LIPVAPAVAVISFESWVALDRHNIQNEGRCKTKSAGTKLNLSRRRTGLNAVGEEGKGT